MLAADLQESSETDDGGETGTGESGDLAGTGSRDLAGGASGRSGTGAGGVATLTTVAAGRVDRDHGRVVAHTGVASSGLAGLGLVTTRDRVSMVFVGLYI